MQKPMLFGKSIIIVIGGEEHFKKLDTAMEAASFYEELIEMSDEEVLEAMAPELSSKEKQLALEFEAKKEESKKFEDIVDFIKEVKSNGHELFEVKGYSLYLKGINITLPERLIREFINAKDNPKRIKALYNFWCLCALNEDPRARHDLFEHLQESNLTITPTGFFIGYRNVNVVENRNKELLDVINKEWFRTKTITKKSTLDYSIVKKDGILQRMNNASLRTAGSDVELVGNLEEMHRNIHKYAQHEFTDARTRTMSIHIGEEVSIPRSECDSNPDADCSRGLHIGNKRFLNPNSFGSQGIIVLINPKDVVAVPHYNKNKMRVCTYLPIGLAEYDKEGKLIELDSTELEYEAVDKLYQELFNHKSLSGEKFEEYKKHEFLPLDLDKPSFKALYDNLKNISQEDANDVISKRKV